MDRPDLDHPWAANLTFGNLPNEAARRFGDGEALLFRDRRCSFRQISPEVDRLARGFIHIGIAPGERVCLWLTNCPEFGNSSAVPSAPNDRAWYVTSLDRDKEEATASRGRA